MNTRGSHSDQDITWLEILTCDHLLLIADANRKTGKIILILSHQTRMLRSLTADQSSFGLETAVCNTLDDIRDLLRIVLAACNIVQEE